MKHLLLIISITFCSITWASSFSGANKLFKNEKFTEAIAEYEEYLANHTDISAYYNLGLAYHQNNEHGKAIWAFQKVLKLDPSDEQAQSQFALCQNEIDSSIDGDPLLGTFESNLYSISSNSWSYFSIFSSIVLAIIIILAFRSTYRRKALLFGAVVTSIFLIAFTVIAFKTHNFESQEFAIAIQDTHAFENDAKSFTSTKKVLMEGSRYLFVSTIDSNYIKVSNDMDEELIVAVEDFKLL